MTGKRFKYSSSLEKVYDCDSFNGETTESYGTFECCDLLNKLNDENKELKSNIKDLKFENEKKYREIIQLEQMLQDVER